MARLRPKLAKEPGARYFCSRYRISGSADAHPAPCTSIPCQAEDFTELRTWEKKIRDALGQLLNWLDVNTDEQDRGLQTAVAIDRDAASRNGSATALIGMHPDDSFWSAAGVHHFIIAFNQTGSL